MEILKILWQADTPCPVAEIRTKLAESVGWKASTVKTLLYNLRDKGAVEEVQRGVYRPIARKTDILQGLIRKLFDGSAKMLVASLLDNDELSESDISELRTMLAKGKSDD